MFWYINMVMVMFITAGRMILKLRAEQVFLRVRRSRRKRRRKLFINRFTLHISNWNL